MCESNEFTESCLDDVALLFRLVGAVPALKIRSYLQENLRSGKNLVFNEIGETIVERSAETAKL